MLDCAHRISTIAVACLLGVCLVTGGCGQAYREAGLIPPSYAMPVSAAGARGDRDRHYVIAPQPDSDPAWSNLAAVEGK